MGLRLRIGLAAAMSLAVAPDLASESETLTTYYPAPSGVYTQMITTGSTYLARDGGSVGIGTTAPAAKLDVVGKVRIADGTQAAGSVLTSDANGLASWVGGGSIPIYLCPQRNCYYVTSGGNCNGQLTTASKCNGATCSSVTQTFACKLVGHLSP